MSIRQLASGKYVLELAGYYLGCYDTKELAESAEADLKATFEPMRVEQEAVEHAIEGCLFRVTAEELRKRSAELNRAIQNREPGFRLDN